MRSFPKIYNSLVVIKILGWSEKTFFSRTPKEGGGSLKTVIYYPPPLNKKLGRPCIIGYLAFAFLIESSIITDILAIGSLNKWCLFLISYCNLCFCLKYWCFHPKILLSIHFHGNRPNILWFLPDIPVLFFGTGSSLPSGSNRIQVTTRFLARWTCKMVVVVNKINCHKKTSGILMDKTMSDKLMYIVHLQWWCTKLPLL